MFLRHDLDELLACDESPAVSIYLPTHPAGREVRQDAIRLRNLLSDAAKRLAATRRAAEVSELLEPARKLVDDEAFWRYQGQGLAVFLAPGFDRIHKLPVEAAEALAVGSHFRIKPLLSLIDHADRFWVLTVTAGRTRLHRGSRWSFAETGGLDLPQGISEIRNETVYQEAHNASPAGRPARGPAGLAKAQAFGEAPDDLHKSQLIELLHRVARAVEPVIRRQPAPVILAATPEIQGNFRELAHWKELLPAGIVENPDAMAAEDLHKKAWRLIAPRQEKTRADALGRLESLLGTGNGKATSKAEDIVKAAHYGRVDRLFLCDGATLWGRFLEQQDKIVAHPEPAADDDDLFDYAALMTLRQGGSVSLVDRTQLPPDGPAAAILRY